MINVTVLVIDQPIFLPYSSFMTFIWQYHAKYKLCLSVYYYNKHYKLIGLV